jgi:hypothetical protein
VRNVREFCLNVDFHVTFGDFLHAVKLGRGTDGFTFPAKEGVLWIFASAGCEPANLGTKGQHATSRPPKSLAYGFTYIYGCRPLRWPSQWRATKTYVKPEAPITVFELLVMGGVSPEICCAIKKHWNNKFYYMVASCWFFL